MPTDQPDLAWDGWKVHSTGELAVFLGGSDTSFTGMLLDLIAKADPGNKAKIRLGFPHTVAVYDAWMTCDPVPTWGEVKAALA